MFAAPGSRFSMLRRSLLMILPLLGVLSSVRAEEPLDAVARLREVLQRQESLPEALLPQAKDELAKVARAIQGPINLRRAVLLRGWQEDQMGSPVSRLHNEIHERLTKSLQTSLGRILRNGDRVSRIAALTLIADLKTSVPVEPSRASAAVEKMTRELAPVLLALLEEKPEPEVRIATARALSRVGAEPHKTIAALRKLLSAKEVRVRRAAASALGQLITSAQRHSFTAPDRLPPGAPGNRRPAFGPREDLLALMAEIAPVAARGLRDEDSAVQVSCLKAIQQAAQYLLRITPSEKSVETASQIEQAWPMVRSLAVPLNTQVPALLAVLKKEGASASHLAALEVLEVLADGRRNLFNLSALQKKLPWERTDPDEPAGANKEGKPTPYRDLLPDVPKAVPLLIPVLSNRDVRLRLAGLYVLEGLAEDAAPATKAVVAASRDSDAFVRWGALRVLGQVAPRQGDSVVPALADRLADDNRDVRHAAASALARYGPAAAGAAGKLAVAVSHEDAGTRLLALHALIAAGKETRPALPALLKALAEKQAPLRAAAAQALAPFAADEKVRTALVHALEDGDLAVRQAATAALLKDQ